MKKLCILVATIATLGSFMPVFGNEEEIVYVASADDTEPEAHTNMMPEPAAHTNMSVEISPHTNLPASEPAHTNQPSLQEDAIVAAMLVQGRNSGSSPSVAYVLYSSGKILCFRKAVNTIPFDLKDARILLRAMVMDGAMYNNNSVVATLIAQGRNSDSTPSVAYALLSNGNVLCFNNAANTTPFSLNEAKILLKAKAMENPVHNKQQTSTYEAYGNSVVTTLIAHGRNSSASPSVAYVLYSNGRVACFNNAVNTTPFTLEEAKILLEAKAQGKLVYNSAD